MSCAYCTILLHEVFDMQEFKTKGFSGVETCHILDLKDVWSSISKHGCYDRYKIEKTEVLPGFYGIKPGIVIIGMPPLWPPLHCCGFPCQKSLVISLRGIAKNWQQFKLGKTTILWWRAATVAAVFYFWKSWSDHSLTPMVTSLSLTYVWQHKLLQSTLHQIEYSF